jgi:hypothetical protein
MNSTSDPSVAEKCLVSVKNHLHQAIFDIIDITTYNCQGSDSIDPLYKEHLKKVLSQLIQIKTSF